jgi:hypothetical protein
MFKKFRTIKVNEFWLILGLSLIFVFFYNSYFVFPIKLFVVFLHEVSHTFAAFLTGARVNYLTFSLDLSGKTIIEGGNTIAIAFSGYLGSLILGAILYLSSFNEKLKKWLLNILFFLILIITINLVKGGIQIFLGLLISIVFFILPRYLPKNISDLVLKFIGISSCLYVLVDIKEDLLTSTLRETDTQVIEYITGIPSMLIGFSWLLISLIVIFFLFKFSLKNQKIK